MIEAVIRALQARGADEGRPTATLAVAESCTGGRLAAALTAQAGASEWFPGGVVAYSNELKIRALGVSAQTLARHGAVSAEVAVQMAAGVRKLTGADYALATTGIAGPGGGTPTKPVGTVWVAIAGPDGTTETQKLKLTGTRAQIMQQAVEEAIGMLAKAAAPQTAKI